jgi:hypothetical protein
LIGEAGILIAGATITAVLSAMEEAKAKILEQWNSSGSFDM